MWGGGSDIRRIWSIAARMAPGCVCAPGTLTGKMIGSMKRRSGPMPNSMHWVRISAAISTRRSTLCGTPSRSIVRAMRLPPAPRVISTYLWRTSVSLFLFRGDELRSTPRFVSHTERPALITAGFWLSRHRGVATAAWAVSTSHFMTVSWSAAAVPTLMSRYAAPAAVWRFARSTIGCGSLSAMACFTSVNIPLMRSPMAIIKGSLLSVRKRPPSGLPRR